MKFWLRKEKQKKKKRNTSLEFKSGTKITKNSSITKYSTLCNDFVSIHENLFEIELQSLSINNLGCSNGDLNILNKYTRSYRTQCALLPINCDGQNIWCGNFTSYGSLTTVLSKINNKHQENNNNKLYPIYIIYNDNFSLMQHSIQYYESRGNGLSPNQNGGNGARWKLKQLFGDVITLRNQKKMY